MQLKAPHPTTLAAQRCLLLVALLLSLFSIAGNAAEVSEARVWRSPDSTRVVLDLSGPVKHTVATLTNPDRVVLDISSAKLTAKLGSVDLANSPITGIRSASKDKGGLRIVFDMASAAQPRSFLLPPGEGKGDRLVIDMADRQAAAKPQEVKQVAQAVKHVAQAGGQRNIVVAIDAGHGGEDPGASGPQRQREKHIVLAIARELEALLRQQRGFKPVMVRQGDYFLPLVKRRDVARSAQADLFVSIHADAFNDRRAHGASVYALSSRGASSATAIFLANQANSSDLVGGVDINEVDDVLGNVLLDLSMTATLDASMQVGGRVLQEMGYFARLHNRRVGQANFVVLRSPDVPSILVETGFISNPEEARKLSTRGYQQQMARAIYRGINAHFSSNPPPGTYIASLRKQRQFASSGPGQSYVIARGDTLSDIAVRHKVSVDQLRKHNGMTSSVIKVGQKISIPAS